jgi:hypothetical protein
MIGSDLQLISHHSIRASTFTRLFSAGVLHGAGLAHVGRKKNPGSSNHMTPPQITATRASGWLVQRRARRH